MTRQAEDTRVAHRLCAVALAVCLLVGGLAVTASQGAATFGHPSSGHQRVQQCFGPAASGTRSDQAGAAVTATVAVRCLHADEQPLVNRQVAEGSPQAILDLPHFLLLEHLPRRPRAAEP